MGVVYIDIGMGSVLVCIVCEDGIGFTRGEERDHVSVTRWIEKTEKMQADSAGQRIGTIGDGNDIICDF